MSLGKIVHIEFGTSDYEKLKGFYTKLFGWSFDEKEQFGYALFDTATKAYTCGVSVSEEPNTMGLLVYFEVESIDQALADAKNTGAKVLMDKAEMGDKGLFAVIKDPFGNTLALWEWAKKSFV